MPCFEVLVNIDVPSLDDGLAFYTTGLGLEQVRLLGERVAEMRAENCRVYLLEKAAGSLPFRSAAASRAYTRHWTPVHLDISVPDIAASLERARQAGAQLETGPTSHAWGTIAGLSDPFGNGFCLIQFTDAGYDAIAISHAAQPDSGV